MNCGLWIIYWLNLLETVKDHSPIVYLLCPPVIEFSSNFLPCSKLFQHSLHNWREMYSYIIWLLYAGCCNIALMQLCWSYRGLLCCSDYTIILTHTQYFDTGKISFILCIKKKNGFWSLTIKWGKILNCICVQIKKIQFLTKKEKIKVFT